MYDTYRSGTDVNVNNGKKNISEFQLLAKIQKSHNNKTCNVDKIKY